MWSSPPPHINLDNNNIDDDNNHKNNYMYSYSSALAPGGLRQPLPYPGGGGGGGSYRPSTTTSPPVTLILTVLLLILFFLGFVSIYLCRCLMKSVINCMNNRHGRPPPMAVVTPVAAGSNPAEDGLPPPGLDPEIIKTFPTFAYSSVKEYSSSAEGMECAICLCDFEDDDILRLLTKCFHVFHQDCVDLWLRSHKSCPVCRQGLDPSDGKPPPPPPPPLPADHSVITDPEETTPSDSTTEVPEEAADGPAGTRPASASSSTEITINKQEEQRHQHQHQHQLDGVGRFSRSHSTGHSIVKTLHCHIKPNHKIHKHKQNHGRSPPTSDRDRYTLRLPEEVKETITRRHMQTLSCTTFGNYCYSYYTTETHRTCLGEIIPDHRHHHITSGDHIANRV